jgi:hypothetical protein
VQCDERVAVDYDECRRSFSSLRDSNPIPVRDSKEASLSQSESSSRRCDLPAEARSEADSLTAFDGRGEQYV